MLFLGVCGVAVKSAARWSVALLRSRRMTLAVWCLTLVGVSAINVVLLAQPGASLVGLAQAAERALAQATDIDSPPDKPADTPSDGTVTPPDGGGSSPTDTNAGPSFYTLTTAADGTGAGLVNVSPAGGPNFNPNTVVTITTTVASNSVFAGWAGACTGTGA
ncbi:MAG: hypothetical protein ACYCZX_18920, partial [Rhodospirillaceae bacterium]